jgi:hypothetical protein
LKNDMVLIVGGLFFVIIVAVAFGVVIYQDNGK